MKPLARSSFLSLLSLVTIAACVEPLDPAATASERDVDVAREESEVSAAPAPAPPAPPPLCGNGNAPNGQMKGVGWTCEINPAGSNLCCDVNLGLGCVVTGKPPFGTECVQVGPPIPAPTPVAAEAPSPDVRAEPS